MSLDEEIQSVNQFVKNLPVDGQVLVTGSTGLIGANLIKILLLALKVMQRHDVRIFAHTRNTSRVETNLGKNLKFIRHNIFELKQCGVMFDAIFHFATFGQPAKFTEDPISTLKLNSLGIFGIESCLKKGGIFYFASSSEVYNGNVNVPHSESEAGFTNTTHPRSMYIEAKRFGEAYCYWKSQEGEQYYSGRISLCYGPGTKLSDARVLNQLVVRGLRYKEIKLHDDGSAIRQYCFVTDTIDIIFRQINASHYEPLNICGEDLITIKDLGKMISEYLGVKFELGSNAAVLHGAPDVVFSSNARSKMLGKKDFVPLSSGIKMVIEWYKELLSL